MKLEILFWGVYGLSQKAIFRQHFVPKFPTTGLVWIEVPSYFSLWYLSQSVYWKANKIKLWYLWWPAGAMTTSPHHFCFSLVPVRLYISSAFEQQLQHHLTCPNVIPPPQEEKQKQTGISLEILAKNNSDCSPEMTGFYTVHSGSGSNKPRWWMVLVKRLATSHLISWNEITTRVASLPNVYSHRQRKQTYSFSSHFIK